jgi:hypothetical protein
MTKFKWAIALCLLPTAAIAALTSAERKSQFEKAMASIMAANTPAVSDTVRERLIKDYVAYKANKGQAVELLSASYFRSCEHEDMSVAGDRSLEACQLRYGKPCALLAVNDDIAVEGALTSKDMPRLHYSGEWDLSQIPIIRAVTRARADVQGYFGAAGPKAVAIHPWGFLFISTGKANSRDTQDAALAACNADPRRNSKDGNCFVYAVDNRVIISERRQLEKNSLCTIEIDPGLAWSAA